MGAMTRTSKRGSSTACAGVFAHDANTEGKNRRTSLRMTAYGKGGPKSLRSEDLSYIFVRNAGRAGDNRRGDWLMALQQNTGRIQTTHIGSLPRPHAVLDLLKARLTGKPYDEKALEAAIAKAVVESVKKQAECGIDIVTDGEMSKGGFFTYIRERLEGFEARPNQKAALFQAEVAAFPEYYEQYFKEAMLGAAIVPAVPLVCVGPVKYTGEAALQRDIANLKAAAKAAGVREDHVFMPATAPSGVGKNEYYKGEEEYFLAVAAALSHEYKAIVAAGFLLQVDDPFLSDIFPEPGSSVAQKARRAEMYVEATNAALRGIPVGANPLPHVLWHQRRAAHSRGEPGQIIGYVLKVTRGRSASRRRIRGTSTNITCSSE